MASAAANLDTAIANLTSRLADISAFPKPTYSIDGENVSWTEYQEMLMSQLNNLMKVRQDLDGAWIVSQRGLG